METIIGGKKEKRNQKRIIQKKNRGRNGQKIGGEGWGTRLYNVREAKIGKSSKQFPELLS